MLLNCYRWSRDRRADRALSPAQERPAHGILVRSRLNAARLWAVAFLLGSAVSAIGCAPKTQIIGEAFTAPDLRTDALQTADGILLPMRTWFPRTKPTAVVLALHGMNEYSSYFDMPAEAWRRAGIA